MKNYSIASLLFVSLFLMFGFFGFAATTDAHKVYLIGGTKFNFAFIEGTGWVSEKCSSQNCKATEKKPKEKLSKYFRKGGVNPGSIYCTETLKGKVVMGFNSDTGQQTFCLFDDESLIDNFSLYKSLEK